MFSLNFSESIVERSRGKIIYIHNGKDSATAAFEINEAAKIRILLPRSLGVVSVLAEVFNEAIDTLFIKQYGEWYSFEDGYDVYEFCPDFSETGVGLFFFRFKIESACGDFWGYKDGQDVIITKQCYGNKYFQLTISDFKYKKPEQLYGGVIYHIFVDRFNKGGRGTRKASDILVDDWRFGVPEYPEYPGAPLKNNTFYGGTLDGIREKLDYIASLGVNIIYLSPIFSAASNHKYDTSDYMSIDQGFGNDDALKDLISAAKEKGIVIILDGVFNHTGSDSIYFNKENQYDSLGAYQSKKSPYYSWYDFQSHPQKYTCWWGIDILPRINPAVQECNDYFVGKNGVIEKYAKFGIGGFRLDVVDELPDSFVESIKNVLNRYNQSSVLYGEVWEDASNKIAYENRKKYYLGSELDGVMNYPLRKGIINYLVRKESQSLEYALTDIIFNAPKRIADMQMNLLGSHDTERILTILGGESSQGRSNQYLSKKKMSSLERGLAKRRLKMAYIILATLPGLPTIFYGDEAGLEGYHDPFNRLPYPWGKEDDKLINFYKQIGDLRKNSSVYKTGDYKLNYINSELLVFTRYEGEVSYTTVVNNSRFDINLIWKRPVKSAINNSISNDNITWTLPPLTAEIFIGPSVNEVYL